MIIDTNIYVALAKGDSRVTGLFSGEEKAPILVPLPVLAELRYGFAKGSQRLRNEQTLERFLAQPQVEVLLPNVSTTKDYAAVQLFCVQNGRALSQNDVWIAALARQNKQVLVTLDRDFLPLQRLKGLDRKIQVIV